MNRLRREACLARPGKGSHIVFNKDGRRVGVSGYGGDIPIRELRSIRQPFLP